MTIYENNHVLPRSYIVPHVKAVSDPREVLDLLANGQIDPRKIVLLEKTPPEFPGSSPLKEATSEITSYTADRVTIHTETNAPAFLVLGDTHYPGWEARIDGAATEVYRANYVFRAVSLPAGSHTVEFIFFPRPYYLGSVIRWIMALGLTGMMIWELGRQKRILEAQPHHKTTWNKEALP
jgi:hypothetical protein